MAKIQSLQARLDPNRADQRLYDPNRDIAHNFRYVVEEAARRLTARKWNVLYDSLIQKPTDEEMGEACKAFVTFVGSAVEQPKETMMALLDRSGFTKCTYESQVAYMAVIGQILTGMYWHGARMSTMGGVGPCSDMTKLIAAGRQTCIYLSAPAWKRWWWKITGRFTRAIYAFRTQPDGSN